MEIIQNLWLAFNIIFGLWSARNWVIYVYAKVIGAKFNQSSSGRMLDLAIPTSCLAFYLTFHV